MDYTQWIKAGSPVVVRSYVSGILVGKLSGGEAGVVVLTDWRWIRRWEGVGGEGSVYDLVQSGKAPTRAGPFISARKIVQQADVLEIDEATYARLAGL